MPNSSLQNYINYKNIHLKFQSLPQQNPLSNSLYEHYNNFANIFKCVFWMNIKKSKITMKAAGWTSEIRKRLCVWGGGGIHPEIEFL